MSIEFGKNPLQTRADAHNKLEREQDLIAPSDGGSAASKKHREGCK
ncbi:MAG: hypothetical protein HFJ21_00050 [Clostridia bacterium]|nr:hypothetical protein [Clostridia bacterium]MCI9458838.1 hypothetical protein [Clostridia bacterium]